MAPAKTAGRSQRTQLHSWSSDSSAMRPVYEWPDHPEDSDTELRDAGREHHHLTSPRASPTTGMGSKLYEGDEDDPGVETRAASRAAVNHGNHLGPKMIKKINYDSDSCLTPRSRRTLRRTLSGSTEPWPSVTTLAAKPTLDTIYSPTHEILHPMQSLMLEKSLNSSAAGIGEGNPLTVSFVTVRATSQGHFTPTRMTQSVDFDSSFKTSQHREQPSFELENDALNVPEQAQQELDSQDDDSTPTTGDAVMAEHQLVRATNNNTVVIIVNAEKKPTKLAALDWAINVAVQPGDEIVILGILKHVFTPMGNKVVANTDPVLGVSQELLKSEMKKITEVFEKMLSDSGRRAECEKKNVKLTVRIAPGARARTVVVRELAAVKATYAVFDRRILRGTRYYNKHLSCHAVRMRSNGRSTKTIFTTPTTSTSTRNNSLTPTTMTLPWQQLKSSSIGNRSYYSGSSPTSDASGSSPSGSSSSSPTHFWRRFTPFKTGSKRILGSPRAELSPAGSGSMASSEVALPGFMSEMQEFSISLDTDEASNKDMAAGSQQRSRPGSKVLESCVVADARAHKAAMDSHRIKHRPVSITIPTICAS